MTEVEYVYHLRRAIEGMVGASEPAALGEMRVAVRLMPVPEADAKPMLNAIDALLLPIPERFRIPACFVPKEDGDA